MDVWSVRLDWPDDHIRRLAASLSLDEQQRAGRFRVERDRNRFLARRAALRALLGEYLGVGPGEIGFVYGPNGKPAMAPDVGLHFNPSHSAGLAVIAVAARPVGVDVERIEPLPDFESIARRFFSPIEISALDGVGPADRLTAFFNCWTRKEAFVKASGEGLSRPLDSFDVSLTPGEPARLLACREGADRPDWTLHAFIPEPEFVGAVASPGSDWTLRCRPWSPPLP